MSKYNSKKIYTIMALLSALIAGCGSSDSNVPEQEAAQTPAIITGDVTANINDRTGANVTGKLIITDRQSSEAAFKPLVNIATNYGFFGIAEAGNWSYTIDADVRSLNNNETLQDIIIVSSIDGTTVTIIITITGLGETAQNNFIMGSQVTLQSDGVNTGLDAYSLIENVFAQGSIESPDMYNGNHQGVVHIIEDTDESVGDHFVFLAHRDEDQDKDKGPSDRQRNEIKGYDKSTAKVLAYQNETLQYSWKFKVSSELELTSKFSHFFQIKARNDNNDNTNGNDDQPIITLSGVQKNSIGNQLQVRYSAGFDENGDSTGLDKNLIETDWSLITDEWVEVFVQATFSEIGKFDMTITRLSDGEELVNISEQNIDMWRGFTNEDFARPKWGIYRSIVETESLRAEEEHVRFADFSIKKGTLAQ